MKKLVWINLKIDNFVFVYYKMKLNNDIEFISEVIDILSTETYSNNIVHKLNRIFTQYMPVLKASIYIWDNNITGLRNFESSWSQMPKKIIPQDLNNMYTDIAALKDDVFFLNEEKIIGRLGGRVNRVRVVRSGGRG